MNVTSYAIRTLRVLLCNLLPSTTGSKMQVVWELIYTYSALTKCLLKTMTETTLTFFFFFLAFSRSVRNSNICHQTKIDLKAMHEIHCLNCIKLQILAQVL